MSKTEKEKARKARNEYSRKWKAKNKKKVQMWNRRWLAAQKRIHRVAHKAVKQAERLPKAA